ncbi:hypothetical protein [Serratia marcescens]|uniref:hypothetical protein n=1 Tax=Serratia marcescens TaxID=615 RepID=UPI0013DAEE87|nr:hypothetical protein [Serratia marcescens]
MAKLKPYTDAQRRLIHHLAAVMVCLEIESDVIAPAFEKATGKAYDRESPDSFTNTFMNNNPPYKRSMDTLRRAIGKERKAQLSAWRTKHGR